MASPASSPKNLHARSVLSLALIAPVLLACDKSDPEPQEAPAEAASPAPPAPQAAEPPAKPAVPAGEVLWDVPTGWKVMPARPMRKATYEAPGAAGAAEIAVFYFGPDQGGDVEANIARWIGQFPGLAPGAAKRSEEEINGMKSVNVDIESGTFASGMPGAPPESKENYAMSASIVHTPSGDYYFKMTGPAPSVAEQKANFAKLLSTIRFEKKN